MRFTISLAFPDLQSVERFCPNKEALGFRLAGPFAEYVVVDSRFSVSVYISDPIKLLKWPRHTQCIIPDNLSFSQAAPLTCAGATAWRAIKRSGCKSGDLIGIGELDYLMHALDSI